MSDTPPATPEPPVPEGERTASASGSALPPKSPGELSLLLQRLAAADDADPGEFEAGLRPGTAVGRFEVLREIGRGGFGAVYEALDRELGRRVALKVLRPRSGRGPAGETLLAEARAICDLHHPGIVALFDIGDGPAGPFLVEELLRGETLEERLARGPLPVAEALPIAIAVARALSHAHRRGVVHRDLKPANVFLCEDGGVKLLDFGLAHLLGRRAEPGAGTPAYMAPEQVVGGELDARADVFAAAVVLFECLAGARPFPAGEEGFPHYDGQAAPLPASVPRPLARAVAQGLALDPAARPGSGRAWLEALRRAEEGAARPVRLRRLGALLAAGAVAGAVVAGVVAWRMRPRLGDLPDEVRKTVAVLPFASLSGDEAEGHLADGVQVEMIATLSQRPDLIVIGRSSVEAWRKPPRDLRAIAAALGVGSVLEGSVQRVGNRIRIVVSLLDPRTGRSVWAEKFDRELSDVLAVQAEVSGHVARTLGATIAGSEHRDERRVNPDAYAVYLEGLGTWTRSLGVSEDDRRARELFQRSVELDPDFAPARALLAQALALYGIERVGPTDARFVREARTHAERALALDPRLPAARMAIAFVLDGEGRPEASEAYEEAYALAPDEPYPAGLAATGRVSRGRWNEALAILERLARHHPRDQYTVTKLIDVAMHAGRLARARQLCADAMAWMPKPRPNTDFHCAMLRAWEVGDLQPLRALASEGDPDVIFWALPLFQALAPAVVLKQLDGPVLAHKVEATVRATYRGFALERLGRRIEARAAFEEVRAAGSKAVRERPDDPSARWHLINGLAGLGHHEEALALARELVRQKDPEPRLRRNWMRIIAGLAARAGRAAEAIEALDQSLGWLPLWTTPAFLRVDPRFEALHGDPRFEAMLAKHTKLPELPEP